MKATQSEPPDVTGTTGERRRAAAQAAASPRRRAGELGEDHILVMRTMMRLLDLLPDSDDVPEVMSHLVEACARLVRQGEASVFLCDKGQLTVYAASSDAKRGLDDHQIQSQSWVREVIRLEKSRPGISLDGNKETWPEVVPLYLAAGMHTANPFVIRYGDDVVGVLDICDPGVFSLSELQIEILTVLSASAGVGIGNRRMVRGLETLNSQLREALNARIVIEQAKGAIAARLDVDVEVAFRWLRSFARNRNRTVHDVARHVVDGSLRAEAIRPTHLARGQISKPTPP